MRGQVRFGGAHQVIDRIRFVPRDRRARRLEPGYRHPVVGTGDPDDLIEAGPVGALFVVKVPEAETPAPS